MSALILPQHGADRKMIKKECGGGHASHVCDGVHFLRQGGKRGTVMSEAGVSPTTSLNSLLPPLIVFLFFSPQSPSFIVW